MTHFQILQAYENFFEMMQPAQINTEENFTWYSGLDHPLFNTVFHLNAQDDLNDKIDHLIRLADNSPISFWCHEFNHPELAQSLSEKGYKPVVTYPLMSCIPVNQDRSEKFTVKLAAIEPFHEILSSVYQFTPHIKESFAKLLNNTPAENYLIFLNDTPIGTGTLIPHQSTGGIFNISVLPSFQKQGAGFAMAQFLLNRAADLKLEQAILLSAPAAVNLYKTLGFSTCIEIEAYLKVQC